MPKREFETGIHSDLSGELTYEGYLGLDQILTAQHPLSDPPHHDEMLFIIQHQTSELWIRLIIHELNAAIAHLKNDDIEPCFKILARVKQIQLQLTNQWSVLETLTPSEYAEFRGVLGHASGFQSAQYRQLEFLLGNKDSRFIPMLRHDPENQKKLEKILNSPAVYDEFLRYLSRRGYGIPSECTERDWSEPYEKHPQLVAVFNEIYADTSSNWDAYNMCEKLVDVEVNFQLWRFRHMKTVERIIGYKRGTGGSSGVEFLRRALDTQFFPELYEVRTTIGE